MRLTRTSWTVGENCAVCAFKERLDQGSGLQEGFMLCRAGLESPIALSRFKVHHVHCRNFTFVSDQQWNSLIFTARIFLF